MATTVASSGPFSLNLTDVLKGLIMAVLVPVITIIMDSINQGSLTFNWKQIGIAALGGFIGYLIKNFLTPAQIVIKDPTKSDVQAVKDGNAEAKVVPSK